MESKSSPEDREQITKPLNPGSKISRVLMLSLLAALILGSTTGYILSQKQPAGGIKTPIVETPKGASQDTRTFRDFSEGVVKVKPTPKAGGNDYTEGTHTLEREGQTPVTLTSSVVDLSSFEGKKVKVYGETQKALKEGWLMDVGKVEEVK